MAIIEQKPSKKFENLVRNLKIEPCCRLPTGYIWASSFVDFRPRSQVQFDSILIILVVPRDCNVIDTIHFVQVQIAQAQLIRADPKQKNLKMEDLK